MSISTSGSMGEIIERAILVAQKNGVRAGTGHLLLAILTGTGTAAKTLSLRGLTETSLRGAIRDRDAEPPGLLEEVEERASRYAVSFGVEPSALHLLAAIATVRACQGHQILLSSGLNVDVIRNQALKNMTTGLTREHGGHGGGRRESQPRLILDGGGSKNGSRARPVMRKRAEATAEASEPERVPEPRPRRPLRSRPTDMGRSLEQAQRKTRHLRSSVGMTGSDQDEISDLHVENDEAFAAVDDLREETPQAVSPTRAERTATLDPGSFELSPGAFPNLCATGRNLTALAAGGHLDEVVGREREMEQIADVLNKRRANSPCLVGPPGVGKTAVVEALAIRLAHGEAPGLEDRILLEVRPGDLLSGTSLRGALSERLDALRAEVAKADGRVILFFDEIHALLASSDGAEAVQELKAALGRGELPCIAATTDTEYARHVEADAALARRFTVVEIEEPDEDDALRIVEGLATSYGDHHGVEYRQDALEAAVRLSSRYVPDRALPDKAVSLMDLAGARARRSGRALVGPDMISQVLAEQIGVPADRLSVDDQQRLLTLEDDLSERVIGHRHVLSAIGETLRRNAAGFRSGRPIGSFLFLGPTGVGKTETAKALADLMFSDGNAMVRLDMSEFSEPHAVARLVGAPPGYVGHEEGGQLTEAVKRRPYSLVLLDEMEKAHRDVVQVLLQVLDDGRLTDGKGRTIVFENTVIVMTSNLGSDLRRMGRPKRRVGFGALQEEAPAVDVSGTILESAKSALPPELWNRIDEPLVFAPLSEDEVAEIARLLLDRVGRQLRREQGIELEVGDSAVDALIRGGGFDPQLGARPMRRTIQRMVEGPVARLVLAKEILRGQTLTIDGDEDGLSFDVADPGLTSTA